MARQDQFRIPPATKSARAIAARAEAETRARHMELSFLMTATLVFIVMAGLVIGFSFS